MFILPHPLGIACLPVTPRRASVTEEVSYDGTLKREPRLTSCQLSDISLACINCLSAGASSAAFFFVKLAPDAARTAVVRSIPYRTRHRESNDVSMLVIIVIRAPSSTLFHKASARPGNEQKQQVSVILDRQASIHTTFVSSGLRVQIQEARETISDLRKNHTAVNELTQLMQDTNAQVANLAVNIDALSNIWRYVRRDECSALPYRSAEISPSFF